MPFNGSGVYSPPGANYPAVANTLITAANRNAIDADIATGLSTCITKDGQTTVTANIPLSGFSITNAGFQAINGTVGSPAISFTNDTDCGFYRIGANNIGLSVDGTKLIDMAPAIVAVTGSISTTLDMGFASGRKFYMDGVSLNGDSYLTESSANVIDVVTGGGVSLSISSATVTVGGDLSVNGGDLITNQTTFNLLNSTATTVNAFGAATSVSIGANAGNFTVRGILSGAFKPRVNATYTPGDTTPSVLDSGILSIANAGATTITNFDDGVTGQLIYLFFEDANTTVNRANCVLAGGVNFTSSANDILVLIKTATVWAEVCRSVNS